MVLYCLGLRTQKQLNLKIKKQPEKNKVDEDSLEETHKEFIKNNRLTKPKQKHDVVTEEENKLRPKHSQRTH